MEEDLIASLTHQVKEEVIENYLTERQLIGFQIEDFERQAEEVHTHAAKTGRRLSRMALLMIDSEMVVKLNDLLSIPPSSFWSDCLSKPVSRGIRIIRVRALTDRKKFVKLLYEAYNRLHLHMEKYGNLYEEINAECRAVNRNINKFQNNFDLLTILNFLKSLDPVAMERKHYLGENFTAEEMTSVDQKLYVRPIDFQKLNIPSPLLLAKPERVEGSLENLAQEVYRKHQNRIKGLML